MRISTNMIFDLGANRLSQLQAGLVKTQQQLSTQRRVLTPADDPVAAASALGISQSLSINEQFASNRNTAKSALGEMESILQSVTSLYQDVKTLIVNAGNGSIEDEQRQYLSAELKGRFEELLGLANSRDGIGRYMFGGFKTSSQPFFQTATGAQYAGDQGKQLLQVDTSRNIALNDTGNTIFEANRTGNGIFLTSAAAGNTGSGIIGTGAVVNAGVMTGHDYSIDFTVVPGPLPTVPGTTTFTVRDNVTGNYMDPATGVFNLAAPPAVGTTYAAGEAISVDGMQFEIQGNPANGDQFDIEPSRNQSIFTTLTNLLTTLNTTGAGAAGQANLTNGLNAANNNIDHALDTLLNVRASVGTRLKEIETLDSSGSDLNIQYTETLHRLQDINLAETISSFTQQQIALQAAQQSFTKITGLSLFNFI
ncbi:flagellar hook-associated protein 3 [Noviherbaspirillum cavernae]|uniref:Flagellar hook-associated protein 3 n=1 Tax=Noviherbaspirillum cavernae TaxID=2320862 RepID=A0A418X0B1_9BURK|nr:flagellar hook-associated protein FlgL [Noviherbaspirillum cavernae]RJG05944.1 flagellar hook-associated protein 3 [Noviherbaspirillum cavernae]